MNDWLGVNKYSDNDALNAALEADAEYLEAMGQDAGITLQDLIVPADADQAALREPAAARVK